MGRECHGVVWFRLEKYCFFPSEILKRLSRKTHFRKALQFCTFVCNHGALKLRPQVLALPALVTMARPKRLHKNKHLQTVVARSNFSTVMSPTMFFSLYFLLFSCYNSEFFLFRHCCPLWLISVGKMKRPDVASLLTEKTVPLFFRPLSYSYNSGNYGRYFSW